MWHTFLLGTNRLFECSFFVFISGYVFAASIQPVEASDCSNPQSAYIFE